MAGLSLRRSGAATVVDMFQSRPRVSDRLATIPAMRPSLENDAATPMTYAVPSPPTESHGSPEASAAPPVQAVRPGMVLRFHVLPPLWLAATMLERAATPSPTSCIQLVTMLRGLRGSTAIEGSLS